MTPTNPTQAAQLLTELKNVQFNSQYEDAKEAAEKWLLTNLSRIIEALTAQLSAPREDVSVGEITAHCIKHFGLANNAEINNAILETVEHLHAHGYLTPRQEEKS